MLIQYVFSVTHQRTAISWRARIGFDDHLSASLDKVNDQTKNVIDFFVGKWNFFNEFVKQIKKAQSHDAELKKNYADARLQFSSHTQLVPI